MSILLRARIPLACALLVFGLMGPVRASVVTYMDTETLVRLSPVIVRGEVVSIVSRSDAAHTRIYTDVTIRVQESLKGTARDRVTLRLIGGIVDGLGSVAAGSPTFDKGERVLVFLAATGNGALTVTGLFQGKFRIETKDGVDFAAQEGARDAEVVRRAGRPETHRRPLAELLAEVRELVTRGPSAAAGATTPPAVSPDAVGAAADLGFTLHQIIRLRWFEADSGTPVTMVFNPNSAPSVPGGARAQFEASSMNWTNVSGAQVVMHDGGDTANTCWVVTDHVNSISHDTDCQQLAFDTASCSGVLALTVTWFSLAQSKVVNGVTFFPMVDTDIVTNDGAECFFDEPGNYGEVISHEMGHVLGLGHSCGDAFSPACEGLPVSDDATMRAFAHGDGRGPVPHAGDINGVRFMYPPPGFVDAKLNGTSFTTGQTMSLTADFNGTDRADVYVILVVPGGGFIALGASAPNTLAPLAANLQLGFAVDSSLFNLTFAGSEPAGSYTWLTILARPGTNPTQAANRLSADAASFTFAP